MKSKPFAALLTVLLILSVVNEISVRSYAQEHSSRPEEIEWTWEVQPPHPDSKLPNILLVGDSITRNYYAEVQRQLTGAANVYLFASSASIGDMRLLNQLSEFAAIESVPFRVVHFNNGMHGWTYSEAQYKAAFPDYLARIHAIAPGASLIWATTTAVKAEKSPGPTNSRVNERNNIAQSFVRAEAILIDDQHGLMLQHPDRYQDTVHFDEQGSAIQGNQVARYIRNLLPETQ